MGRAEIAGHERGGVQVLIGDAETNPFPSSPYLNLRDSLFGHDKKKKPMYIHTLPLFSFNFVKLYFDFLFLLFF